MPVVPPMNASIDVSAHWIAGCDPMVECTTAGDGGRQSGPLGPSEALLVKQIRPVGRDPVQHRREIPSDIRLSLTLQGAFGETLAGHDEFDTPHRPAMTGRPPPRRLRVRNPADADFEGFRAPESGPVIRHRCSTPTRCCVCRRFGNASSGAESPALTPQDGLEHAPARHPRQSEIRAMFHHCSKRPRMRCLSRSRSDGHPHPRRRPRTIHAPWSAAMDGAVCRRRSPGRRHHGSIQGIAFRIRRPVASVCA